MRVTTTVCIRAMRAATDRSASGPITITTTDGHKRLNPSEAFRQLVATTSDTIARASSSHFDTVGELRLALIAFKQTYNQSWIIERHGYRTPAQVRAEQLGRMLMAA